MARHCDEECEILKFIPENQECPILSMKQKRKDGEWWIQDPNTGKRYEPLCEDKVVRVAKKKIKMLV